MILPSFMTRMLRRFSLNHRTHWIIQNWQRDGCSVLLRDLKRQFDYVASQRLRRLISLYGLHCRLGSVDRLTALFFRILQEKILSRLPCSQFSWRTTILSVSILSHTSTQGKWPTDGQKKLPDNFILDHKFDVEYAQELTLKTLVCSKCRKRHVIESEAKGIDYCQCSAKRGPVYGTSTDGVAWTPFLENKDIIIWRQPHPKEPGLFIYLMYGKFEEVSASEFLEVQLDLSDFRLSWDENSAECRVLEEEYEQDSNSLSQIYYWEVNWPRFFSNRDYVCNRRVQIFEDENVAVMYSKSTSHPAAPKKTKNFRVDDYWSVLSVKSLQKDWTENGVEFSLIAYENPGLSLPTSITTWVAIRGMPEFMNNLRTACLRLRNLKDSSLSRVSVKESPVVDETKPILRPPPDKKKSKSVKEEEGKVTRYSCNTLS